MKAVFGLGNPGSKYQESRHNVGFMVVSSWGEELGIKIKRKRFSARSGAGSLSGEKLFLLLPQTYMNRSGLSVSGTVSYFKLSLKDIIVVHDDMDLEFGRLKVKKGGGSGGHRGIESIIDHLDSRDFIRLRIGIGRPANGDYDTTDFVLSPFSPEERESLKKIIERAIEALSTIACNGVDFAMNRFNELV